MHTQRTLHHAETFLFAGFAVARARDIGTGEDLSASYCVAPGFAVLKTAIVEKMRVV